MRKVTVKSRSSRLAVLLVMLFLQSQGQRMSGRIKPADHWRPVLFLHTLEDFEDEYFADSIPLNSDGTFAYQFTPAQLRSGLIRISIVQEGWGRSYQKEGIGENSLVIPIHPGENLILNAEAQEFYFSHRLEPDSFYSAAAGIRDLKSPFRQLLLRQQKHAAAPAENREEDLFREEWEAMLDVYKAKLIPYLDTEQPEGIRLLGLYNYFLSDRGRYDTLVFRKVIGSVSEENFGIVRALRRRVDAEASISQKPAAPLPIVEDIQGKRTQLDTLKSAFFIFDFWASWCSPCVKAFKRSLPELYDRLSERNVQLLGINVDANRLNWLRVLQKERPAWPQYRDAGPFARLATIFQVTGLPTYLVLDSEFRMIYRSSSAEDVSRFLDQQALLR